MNTEKLMEMIQQHADFATSSEAWRALSAATLSPTKAAEMAQISKERASQATRLFKEIENAIKKLEAKK